MPYFLVPFIGWLISGIIKFLINLARYGQGAKERIGNGGFPSTHTTTLVTTTVYIAVKNGWNTPVVGVAVGLTFIVILDALGLRQAVGEHARALNNLLTIDDGVGKRYRESMGHKLTEILGGIVLGTIIGFALNFFSLIGRVSI